MRAVRLKRQIDSMDVSPYIIIYIKLYLISFGIIEPILFILKTEYCLSQHYGLYAASQTSVAYEKTQSKRVSDFRDFVCSSFPKAILFDFLFYSTVAGVVPCGSRSDFFTCASRVPYSHFLLWDSHFKSQGVPGLSYSGKFCNGRNDFLVGHTLYNPSKSWDA